jgi:hypothetical protein
VSRIPLISQRNGGRHADVGIRPAVCLFTVKHNIACDLGQQTQAKATHCYHILFSFLFFSFLFFSFLFFLFVLFMFLFSVSYYPRFLGFGSSWSLSEISQSVTINMNMNVDMFPSFFSNLDLLSSKPLSTLHLPTLNFAVLLLPDVCNNSHFSPLSGSPSLH